MDNLVNWLSCELKQLNSAKDMNAKIVSVYSIFSRIEDNDLSSLTETSEVKNLVLGRILKTIRNDHPLLHEIIRFEYHAQAKLFPHDNPFYVLLQKSKSSNAVKAKFIERVRFIIGQCAMTGYNNARNLQTRSYAKEQDGFSFSDFAFYDESREYYIEYSSMENFIHLMMAAMDAHLGWVLDFNQHDLELAEKVLSLHDDAINAYARVCMNRSMQCLKSTGYSPLATFVSLMLRTGRG